MYKEFLKKGNYLKNQTYEERVEEMVAVVKKYEKDYNDTGLSDRVRDLILRKILIPSTPQWGNLGIKESKNGTTPLNCSCNIISVGNSIKDIAYSWSESAMLSKLGAGVGVSYLNVADKGTEIEEGFKTNSVLDWIETGVSITSKISQNSLRRGYSSPFLSIESPDFYELLERVHRSNSMQKDPLLGNTAGIFLPKGFDKVLKGERQNYIGIDESRERFIRLLEVRQDSGNIYVVFGDNMDKNKSEVYEKLGHVVQNTNICTEIVTPHYDDKTMTCIIASLNLNMWDEIKEDDQIIEDAYKFLDINVTEYIRLTENVPFLEKARRSAIEKRDIGLGTLGFHDYLQEKMLPFGSVGARAINQSIYKKIREVCDSTNRKLAEIAGACPMAKEAGLMMRNVSMMMVAPNKSTSFIAGGGEGSNTEKGCSLGIEPIMSNTFMKKLAGISTVYRNKRLEKILEEKGMNTEEVWESISSNFGSVQHLDFLSELEKAVFKTFAEISPKDIIDLAAARQKYIDMAQSINLIDRKYDTQSLYDIHMYAYEKGIKTLYYMYPHKHGSFMDEDEESPKWDDCESCAD